MTIPIAPVSIHPQAVPRQQSPWAELFLQALQHGQELQLQREQLKRQQEQFEFQKKLAGPQQEALQLENLKRKRDLQTAQEDQDAQGRALTVYTGMLTQGHISPEQWATELQHANDPLVHKWLTYYRDEAIKTATAQQTLQNLSRPPADYTSAGMTPEGTPVKLNTRTGQFSAGGPTLHQPGTSVALAGKIKLGARNAANAVRQAVALVARYPDANRLPVVSEIAGSAAESRLGAWVPGLSGAAGALRRKAMSPNQNKFQNLLNIIAHNSVGLLPGSRQSLVLFQNLRDSYSSAAGDPPELRAQKLQLLQELGVGLDALAHGQDVSLAHLPGFEDFEPLGIPSPPGTTTTPQTPTTTPATPVAPNPARYFRP